ncbi:arsenic resistance N-acetyltransferase ArsN2 [Halomontanus rarus]|uniref:arsenic resistance N-acetyltransferase ArsN2 n=1 Tax=Halomontanus rarus TaxID=3034020 RepID=UPI0023E88A54|nr:arsenic resistance N-acetyltransferase ArsN2 [Halovivax sp. TS33]
MSGVTVTLQPADDSTRSHVETVLEENDLPSRDVRSKLDCFYIGYDGADTVGVGGIEIRGTDGLLRSVAVERSARGKGFGTAICEALETEARAEEVETLYLLTTTAPEFFAEQGYAAIDRTGAPGPIQQTTEFDDLCPTTATCMKKSL